MRVLVYPHDLGIGGSQINAIELAGAVRELGHDVMVYGTSGVLESRIATLGLEFVSAPKPGKRPSHLIVRHLRSIVRSEGIDVLHAYEWPPILEAMLASRPGSVCVGTIMSMAVAPFVPNYVPLAVGTEQIAAVEALRGRSSLSVIRPPVDTNANAPFLTLDLESFKRAHGVGGDGRLNIVMVTRLARELKLEGILCAIGTIPEAFPECTLLVVGDGPERHAVARAAREANSGVGRRAVILTGELQDPRPAYAMADVVLGMGGSALRAMAFEKPVVVQGEQGFWRLLTADTAQDFAWTGWYGSGRGHQHGPATLVAELAPLLGDPALRERSGTFARELVLREHSLGQMAELQLAIYEKALTDGPRKQIPSRSDFASALRFLSYEAKGYWSRARGCPAVDDFNAAPVVLTPKESL